MLFFLVLITHAGIGTATTDTKIQNGKDFCERPSKFKLSLNPHSNQSSSPAGKQALPACLVAAKLVYFGVGGGVSEFTRAIESGVPTDSGRQKGEVQMIWRKEEGVKRVIMTVHWG